MKCKPILFSVAFIFQSVTHSSENGRFGSSPKPSAPERKRFPRLPRDFEFFKQSFSNLDQTYSGVQIPMPVIYNDVTSNFRLMKTVILSKLLDFQNSLP